MYIDAKLILFASIVKHSLKVVIMISHQTFIGIFLSLMQYALYKLYSVGFTSDIFSVTSPPICLDSI